MQNNFLLQLEKVTKSFPTKSSAVKRGSGSFKALDEVGLHIMAGETVGLVGESGSGKSTIGRLILGLMEPDSGKISFKGEDINRRTSANRRKLASRIQMVFQDPYSSLNPRMTIKAVLEEPLRIHKVIPVEIEKRLNKIVDLTGISRQWFRRYPGELSGGQRQRVAIARALALEPELIIADEPLSALDLSIQAQILLVLEELQRDLGLSYLFISHDLGVVDYLCDRTVVLYRGKLMETADNKEIFDNPLHPYTEALLSAAHGSGKRKDKIITGEPFSYASEVRGCAFRDRCQTAVDQCNHEQPEFVEIKSGHWVACHNSSSSALSSQGLTPKEGVAI